MLVGSFHGCGPGGICSFRVPPRDGLAEGNSCLVSGHSSAFGLCYMWTLSPEPLCIEDRFYPLGCCEANHGIAPLRVALAVKMV